MLSTIKIVQHVYQKSAHGGIIFYSSRDAVIFFTIFCVCARKYGIRPTMLCIMADHTHGLYPVKSREQLSAFVAECYRLFAREYNVDACRCGQLFKHQFGCATKYGDKQIRSINAYVANNPVEKKICLKAEEYQWNFLAYATSDHPFSERLVLRQASPRMRKAVSIIRDLLKRKLPVNYRIYDRISEGLSRKEKRQLIDYIVTSYNVLDYEALLSYYKSYEGMLEAFANTKGAEYDLNEEFDSFSNRNYGRMAVYLKENCRIEKAKGVVSLPEGRRNELAIALISDAGFPAYQVRKYLHLPLE